MPPINERRYIKLPLDFAGKKWKIQDNGLKIYESEDCEEITVMCYNLNKEHYEFNNPTCNGN